MLLGSLSAAGTAHADPAAAEALFREGRRLLDAGQYAEACAKLAESQAQDPASGTLINLALCYEKEGKLASAWAQYRLAASLARQDGRPERVASAEEKAFELEGRVPRLTLLAPHPVPNMVASWGTGRVGVAAFGSPIPLDPGTYVITLSAPGYVEQTHSLELHAGEQRTLELPELALQALPGSPVPSPAPPPRESAPPPATAPPAPQHATPVAAYVLGGAGIVSLGVGAFFGVSSLSAYADAERGCPSHHACPESTRDPRDKAQTDAWISNVALGVGILATGAAGLWLYTSHAAHSATALGVAPLARGAALTLSGTL